MRFAAAPDPDDQEHRNQAAFEEQVEQEQVQRHEDADHQRLEQEERDHVLLDPVGDVPGRGDHQRHQERGQHHEQHRDAVHADLVLEPHEPLPLLDELEVRVRGIEAGHDEERGHEGDGRRQERDPLGVALRGLVLAPEQEERHAPERRQEGDERKKHHSAPPVMVNQVSRTASPITMAKA
jgi:hypothetical protein